jgi:hypothetical protein
MKTFFFPILLFASLLTLASCGGTNRETNTVSSNETRAGTSSPEPASSIEPRKSEPTQESNSGQLPVATGHGAANKPPINSSNGPSPAPGAAPDTTQLDTRIKTLEAKAKARNASPADKKAVADAYLERANLFYNAGQPTLYKFALRDFRMALRYDPGNAEAAGKRDQIVEIYQQLNRPVPDLGNEP